MFRLLPIAILAMGCAGFSDYSQVPCLRGFQLDLHKTWGDNDSRSFNSSLDDGRGYKPVITTGRFGGADYDEIEFGGSVHFVVGEPPRKCPAYQKPKGPDERKWVK